MNMALVACRVGGRILCRPLVAVPSLSQNLILDETDVSQAASLRSFNTNSSMFTVFWDFIYLFLEFANG